MYNLVLTLTIRHSYGGLVYEALFTNPKRICKEESYNVAIGIVRHTILHQEYIVKIGSRELRELRYVYIRVSILIQTIPQ